jgi:hypothetical protein
MPDLSALIVPLKSISTFPGWQSPEPETGYSWFDAPLEIGGVTEPGFVLHGGCFLGLPDQHVSLELRLSKTPGRRARPLERIDWRSRQPSHSNKRRFKGAAPIWRGRSLAGKRVGNTHLHAFEVNWLSDEARMRDDDLPFAHEIDEELQTFEDFLIFSGKQFRINNIGVVTRPQWEYKLGLENP